MLKVSPNIWALGWVSFFTDLATAMIKPLIPIYVVLVLNQGMDKLGYVLAITSLVSYLLRWLGGWLSDRLQVTKPLLLIGYGLSAIMKPLFPYATTWSGVASISALERLGKAIRSAPKDVLISASAQQAHQGRAFGVHKTLDIAGETVGGIIAFALLYWLGQSPELIRLLFELTIIPGLFGVFVLIFFVKDTIKQPSSKPLKISVWRRLVSPGYADKSKVEQLPSALWSWLLVYFLAVFFMLNDSFMVMRGSEIGIATHWLPLLMVSSALTQTLISYKIGKQIDNQGAKTLIIISLGAGLMATLLLFIPNSLTLVAAFILQGVFMVAGLNALRARIGQTRQAKGRAYGLFYLGTALAMALGNILMGQLWEHFNSQSALALSAIGLFLLLMSISLRKNILAGEANPADLEKP